MVDTMQLKDKLQMLMARANLNGQKLARLSAVSDSEISRILHGKSRPGLDNAFRLAKAVGVTLDYLADDSADAEPGPPQDALSSEERRILALIHKIGMSEVRAILEIARLLGYETAVSRLIGAKPVVEVESEPISEAAPSIPPSFGGMSRAGSAGA